MRLHQRGRTVLLGLVTAVCLVTAAQARAGDAPESLGFRHFYKCPSDADVDHLGDTVTAEACLAACEAHPGAAGCWWLDGSGGFPRECRLCRTLAPRHRVWNNDWASPLRGIPTS